MSKYVDELKDELEQELNIEDEAMEEEDTPLPDMTLRATGSILMSKV